ncbi:type VI secretion system protein ImpJ [Arboricoccus pini]|uniref:Type VI secretion system protein ImpJ n=1 Tax=Arboricoccus pini TaxID=1963835 RepID=A0A212RQ98_9PROT|nr:type VI secretion system baseplate subunit TssK [Arboricoccus pini]SNB74753.1 type VI secretion system protein ImpJ [Arboricoccus pini]
MSWDNKVVWSEGLFLRPQHLQQSDRYFEKLVRVATTSLVGHGWGFTELKLNRELLSLGKIAIERARGITPDGMPFAIPDDADQPRPYDVPEHLRNEIIHLAVPLHQPGSIEIGAAHAADIAVRYIAGDQELVDNNAGQRDAVTIEVARLRFEILPEGADRSGFASLPIARLVERRPDLQVVLDEGHVVPALDCGASVVLAGYVTEIHGLLHHRAEALADRVVHSGTRGVAEIADFLLLQAINRWEPLFGHYAQASLLHPESLYLAMAQLAGELATYAGAQKHLTPQSSYQHTDLARSFLPLIQSIRTSLGMVLEQSAVPIRLRLHKYGVQIAEVSDRTLFTSATFVLAVRADIEATRLRREFPSQIKIGPAEKIKELVNVALPGIVINALPVAPRQIPFHAGTTYFEVDPQSPYWRDLRHSSGLALHVAGEFPNLELALWAIRAQ